MPDLSSIVAKRKFLPTAAIRFWPVLVGDVDTFDKTPQNRISDGIELLHS